MVATCGRSLGLAGACRTIVAIGSCIVAAGLAIVVVRYLGRSPAETGVEAWMGPVALGAVIAAPGVLAILSLSDRPALLLPAATVLIPVSFLSFAGVLLPLLVLAGCPRRLRPPVGAATGPQPSHRSDAGLGAVLLVAAGAPLLVHQDRAPTPPRSNRARRAT